MSINKLISIHDSVFNAQKDMGIDTTADVPTLTRWAVEAEREIGSYYGWKKQNAVLTGVGCIAYLPCQAMRVQYVIMGDHGCDCGDLVRSVSTFASNVSATVNDTFFVVDKPTEEFMCGGINWEVQNNKLVFQGSVDGQKLTIQYLGYELDCDGFPMVNENHIVAISNYIKWKFAERSRFSPIKMDHADIAYMQRRWVEEKLMARAEDSQISETDREQIVSMLHDPYIGFGLNCGMHTAGGYYGTY